MFLCVIFPLPALAQQVQPENAVQAARLQHFETKIRPVLIQHCQQCHAVDTERSGGLLLDSAEGWQRGGDSGPAIELNSPEDSLLLRAIGYADPKLQMPPDGKLPPQVVKDFKLWIEQGAIDPRANTSASKTSSRALSVAESKSHWAYQPLTIKVQDQPDPDSSSAANLASTTTIDYWIERELVARDLQLAPPASPEVLVRRLFFDLSGLPPTPEQLVNWTKDWSDQRAAQLVDALLDSPHFGEKFARHWMDVVRYADSVTLRGFILPQAWRYRDYLIEAYNQDRSFQQMIREQIAGDLLPANDSVQRSQQLIATTFWTLGNTNLEEQDKAGLDMDYLDEQLSVLCEAFLGQTIGCARCHDHKFDPIPTRDYYAMAGILKSSTGLKHENVSQWIEQPLPLAPAEQAEFEEIDAQAIKLSHQIQQLKKKIDGKTDSKQPRFIPPSELPGIVVDSAEASLVGAWTASQSQGSIVGESYLHDGDADKGQKSATFEPKALPPGEYELLFAYQSGQNRASEVRVKIFSADGETEVKVDQRRPAPESNLWFKLGRYRFEENGQKYVLISNDQTQGHVIVDAIIFLPVDSLENSSLTELFSSKKSASSAVQEQWKAELKLLERKSAELQAKLDLRPKYMTILESNPPQDIPIHIRGDVHRLGEVVPRGFLTAIDVAVEQTAPPDRLTLASWIADQSNPLTARVYANRIWQWLMGRGIVSTTNNFGTTGSAPTHRQLLDSLAVELIRSNWSTKGLVRLIVLSKAYQRSIIDASSTARQHDPDNLLYWRGTLRRINVESLRDAMLSVSGELDLSRGGSLIRAGTKTDYNYQHNSTRRSIYQPVFRNSLPELFDEFDFGNPSVPTESRFRSSVALQGLALLHDPWVIARAEQAAIRYVQMVHSEGLDAALNHLFLATTGRPPSDSERRLCYDHLLMSQPKAISDDDVSSGTLKQVEQPAMMRLIHSVMASMDFRFLD